MGNGIHIAGSPSVALQNALTFLGHQFEAAADSVFEPGSSQYHCIRSTLIFTHFFLSIGLDAGVASCALLIGTGRAQDEVSEARFAIGLNQGTECPADKWNGHLVSICGGYLIDPTLGQAITPRWDNLPRMIAIPIAPKNSICIRGADAIGGIRMSTRAGEKLNVLWLNQPTNDGWKKAARPVPCMRVVKRLQGLWGRN